MSLSYFQLTEEALRVAEGCYPILMGEPSLIQGAALCELVSRHLAGHVVPDDPEKTAELRKAMLEAFVATVELLIPVADEQVIQPELERRGKIR